MPDLRVPGGTTLALIGPTGAGKSTVAKLIARFYDPTAGRVTLDGVDLRRVRLADLRQGMGYVPQEGFLFSGTIADNIRFGRPGATRAEVEAAARAVGADQVIAGLPDGYDTQVGERGALLAAGERQLVAFARAWIADPALRPAAAASPSCTTASSRPPPGPSGSEPCSPSSPRSARPPTRSPSPTRAATSGSRTSASPTTRGHRCCTTSTWRSTPGRPLP